MKARTILAAGVLAVAGFAAGASARVLPNGWTVTPAGAITPLGTLPLRMAVDPGGRRIAVMNGGYGRLSVTVVDAASGRVAGSFPLDGAFYGIAFAPDGRTLYASTAQHSGVRRFAFDGATGALHDLGSWQLAKGDVWASGASDPETFNRILTEYARRTRP